MHPATDAELDAFISAGFRLGAWGVALSIAMALGWQTVLVLHFGRDYDLAASATRAAKGAFTAILSLRGLEGLVEDTRLMRILMRG